MERQTFMEQLNKRVSNIENYLEKIGPVEKLFERISMLEENIYTTDQKQLQFQRSVYVPWHFREFDV